MSERRPNLCRRVVPAGVAVLRLGALAAAPGSVAMLRASPSIFRRLIGECFAGGFTRKLRAATSSKLTVTLCNICTNGFVISATLLVVKKPEPHQPKAGQSFCVILTQTGSCCLLTMLRRIYFIGARRSAPVSQMKLVSHGRKPVIKRCYNS